MDDLLYKQVLALGDESDLIAYLANVSACLNEGLHNINWVGFYLYKNDELVLGPFQGKVACSHLPINKGVCGVSFAKEKVLNVKDVHKFDGHIACDSASNSELVLPLFNKSKCVGVLDIDSPIYERFSEQDVTLLTNISKLISEYLSQWKGS